MDSLQHETHHEIYGIDAFYYHPISPFSILVGQLTSRPPKEALEASRNALYKFSSFYLLTYLLIDAICNLFSNQWACSHIENRSSQVQFVTSSYLRNQAVYLVDAFAVHVN